MKVVVLTNIMAPYRVALFNHLGAEPDIDLDVWFMAGAQANRSWRVDPTEVRFEHEILPNISPFFGRRDLALHINRGVGKKLRSATPDVIVIGGYARPASWTAWRYGRRRATPVVFWSGTTLESGSGRNVVLDRMRRWIIKGCDAYVAYGEDARAFQEHFGADPQRITISRNTVDVLAWQQAIRRTVAERPAAITPGSCLRLLYVGQLIERKGLAELVSAVADVARRTPVALRIVGDGPMRAELERRCEAIEAIELVGAVERGALPAHFAAADALVVPSHREVWGLVINESLACGTFVVASTRAGATRELIRSGFNGLAVDPLDAGALREALRWTVSHVETIRARRDEIMRDARERFSLADSAAAFANCLRQAGAR